MTEDQQDYDPTGRYTRSIAPGQTMNFVEWTQNNPGLPSPPYAEPLPPEPMEQLLKTYRELVEQDEASSARSRQLNEALGSGVASQSIAAAKVEAAKIALEQALVTDDEPAAEAALAKAQSELNAITKRISQVGSAIKALPDNDAPRELNIQRNAILRWVAREELKRLPTELLDMLRGAYACAAHSGSSLEWSEFLAANLQELQDRAEVGVALADALRRYGAEEVL